MANYFHKTAKISKLASIEVSTRGTNTYIGEGSDVDDFVKIKHVGGDKDIRIGAHTYINSGTVIYSGNGITIGDNVLISPNCTLVPVNHEYRDKKTPIRLQGFMPSKGGIVIGDDVWIGAGCAILDGAIIGRGAVIGAHSLVNGKVKPYTVNVGAPSRAVGRRK